MDSRRVPLCALQTLAGALLLLPFGVLLARLQTEMAISGPATAKLLEGFFAGQAQMILHVRILMRWLVPAAASVWPGQPGVVAINAVFQALAAWGALALTWRFAVRALPEGPALAVPFFVAAHLLWSYTAMGYHIAYPYDLPAFLFSAAGLLAVIAGRPLLLGLLVAVGTLNKETTVWLIPAFAAVHWRGKWPARHLAAITLCLVAVHLAAYVIPRHLLLPPSNRSVFTFSLAGPSDDGQADQQPRWIENLRELLLLRAGAWDQRALWALWPHLVALVFLWRLPSVLRRLYGASLVFFAAMLFVANVWEVRVFNELLPLGAVAVVWLIHPGCESGGKESLSGPVCPEPALEPDRCASQPPLSLP